MPDSDRNNKPKTGLKQSAIVAAIFVALFTAWGIWYQLDYHQQAADKSAQYERWAKHEIKAGCPSLGEITKAQCNYQAKHTAHENKRDEYDLYAQRTSALWAGIMAVAALVGIGLSGVGIYLVKTTWDATKESNDISRSAATDAANDASLSRLALIQAERAIITMLAAGQYELPVVSPSKIQILFTVRNDGRSNAENFKIFFNVTSRLTFKKTFKYQKTFNKICVSTKEMQFEKITVRRPITYPSYIVGYLEYTTLANTVFTTYFAHKIVGPLEINNIGEVLNASLGIVQSDTLPPST